MADPMQRKDVGFTTKTKRKSRAKPKDHKEKSDAGRQLTLTDFRYILDWLQTADNQAKIAGTAKNPRVGQRPLTKMAGMREMAGYVNAQKENAHLPNISGESMKGRWKYFFVKYREVKKESSKTGWGIVKADEDRGIFTIKAKLKDMFEFYFEMDALYGSQPNVLPKVRDTVAHGIPLPIETQAIDDDKETDTESQQFDSFNKVAGVPSAQNIGFDMTTSPTSNESLHQATMGGAEGKLGRDMSPDSYTEGQATEPPLPEHNEVQGAHKLPVKKKRKGPRGGRVEEESSPLDSLVQNENAEAETQYPSAKKVTESRHSINSAFADSLFDLNQSRMKANEINAERWTRDENYHRELFEDSEVEKIWTHAFEEKKLAQDADERQKNRVERGEERKDRAKANKQQFLVSLMNASQGRSIDKIMKLVNEAEKST